MKVVINRCYGGFGLSEEAVRALHGLGCEHVGRHEPKDYYGGKDGWEAKYAEDLARDKGRIMGPPLVIDGKIITDEHRSTYGENGTARRACPNLVAVIEKMGRAADGWAAELAVIEIPDGVNFDLDEYDGIESIHEVHRSWP